MSWHVTARRAAQQAGLDPRYLRRLRWISKARSVHGVGASLPANLGFVLLDPEPANFSYELANEAVLADWVAGVAAIEPARARALFEEARGDPILHARLRGATRGRWWWSKPARRSVAVCRGMRWPA